MPVNNMNNTSSKSKNKKNKTKQQMAGSGGGTVQNRTYQRQLAAARPDTTRLQKPPSLPMFVQCVIDPENTPACRLPDDYTSPTSAIKVIEEYTVSSDAAGSCIFGIYAGLSFARIGYTITAGSTGTSTVTAHPDLASITSQFVNGRINCMSINVNYIGPLMTASGRLVAVTDQDTNLQTDNLLITSVLDDGESTPAQNGRRVVIRPRMSPRFLPVSGEYGAPVMPYTYFVGVGLQPNTVVFSVRVVRHFEGIPNKNSVIRGSARPGFSMPHALTMVANMAGIGTMSTADTAGRNKAVADATSAAHAAWNMLGPTVHKRAGTALSLAEEVLTGLMV